MTWLKPLSRCTVLAVLLAVAPFSARADLIPVLDSVVFGGGSYLYSYHVNLSANSQCDNLANDPDFVTLIDFAGYVGGSATVTQSASGNTADWVESEPATGPSAFAQNPPDSAAIPNISFLYAGTTVIQGPLDQTTNPPPAFSFTLRSTKDVSNVLSGNYDGQTTSMNPAGTVQGNSGQYLAPQADVPEPGTMAFLLGFGVSGSAFILRRRRNRA